MSNTNAGLLTNPTIKPNLGNEIHVDETAEVLLNYLLSTIVYMKPIWGQEKNKEGNLEKYVYQDECEWRYIPSDNFPEELLLVSIQ